MEDVPRWTIEELTRRAAAALAGAPATDGVRPGAMTGRGREVPDARAVRWYASIGLVDRPVGGRGRGARYGVRHLRQLVAIKRLQAEGWSLADIQARLAGADDDALGALAPIPDVALAAEAPDVPAAVATLPEPGSSPPSGGRRTDRFWASPAAPTVEFTGSGHGARPSPAGSPDLPSGTPQVVPLTGLELAEGVLLVLRRPPGAADLPVLAEAARPLLTTLHALGLTPSASPSADLTPGAPR